MNTHIKYMCCSDGIAHSVAVLRLRNVCYSMLLQLGFIEVETVSPPVQ